jgi:hypothetical protein
MLAILTPLVSWIFRGVVVKFVILTAVYAVVAVMIPVAISYLTPHIGTGSLTSAFSAVDPSVWFWLDFFQLGFGLPLILSAAVARFLIRRLPFIG